MPPQAKPVEAIRTDWRDDVIRRASLFKGAHAYRLRMARMKWTDIAAELDFGTQMEAFNAAKHTAIRNGWPWPPFDDTAYRNEG